MDHVMLIDYRSILFLGHATRKKNPKNSPNIRVNRWARDNEITELYTEHEQFLWSEQKNQRQQRKAICFRNYATPPQSTNY